MRFHKFIWPAIWSLLTLCIVTLCFSIVFQLCNIYGCIPKHGCMPNHISVIASDIATEDKNPSKATIVTSEESTIKLPIIMYHALINDSKLQNKYFISPNIFENDLKYLKEHDYTTVTMTEVINHVHNGTPLPKNPIVLTFDDGYYNNYLYAYPALQKYNQKAVISIIGKQSDRYSLIKENNSYYSHLTWNQINEMIISGHVEIQNHTYDMHTYDHGRKGCMENSGESFDTYQSKFVEDVGQLQQRITDYTGITPNTMTYPFGFYSKTSETVIKEMGFKASLTCSERMNTITDNPECLYRLGRYLRPPDKSSKDFFENILEQK